VKHPGDAVSYCADIALMPQDKWGIIVLQNSNWMGMEGETGGIIAGIEQILSGSEPSPQPFNSGNLMLLFDGICILTLCFLVFAFARLKSWKRMIAGDKKERLRRRLIPVLINSLLVPACIATLVPKFFSADWLIGFLHGPDFTLTMLTLTVSLLALGVFKVSIVVNRMAALKAEQTDKPVR
jgi:hypothetical protein